MRIFPALQSFFTRLGPRWSLFFSFVFALGLGYLDYRTGFEATFSFFYLLPIALATLFVNFESGLFITCVSVFIWTFSNWLAGDAYHYEWTRYWNIGVRLVTFMAIADIVHELQLSMQHENLLARTDFLTGISNSREFYRFAGAELERARRSKHPFSIAYLDLDHFKQLNDRLGHSAGDDLLCVVAQTISSTIRNGDMFARIGGDEFVLLLPETNEADARKVVVRSQKAVSEKLKKDNTGVTVSIGVVTFEVLPKSVDGLIKAADHVMYQAKTKGKDTVVFRVVRDSRPFEFSKPA